MDQHGRSRGMPVDRLPVPGKGERNYEEFRVLAVAWNIEFMEKFDVAGQKSVRRRKAFGRSIDNDEPSARQDSVQNEDCAGEESPAHDLRLTDFRQIRR